MFKIEYICFDNFLNNEYLLHNFENYGKKYYKIFATQDIIKKTINCNAKKTNQQY